MIRATSFIVRPACRRTSFGSAKPAPTRVLFEFFDREPFPAAGQAPSRAMVDLQPFHAQGLANRKHRFGCGADGGIGCCANASDPAGETRVACGRDGGSRRDWTAPDVKPRLGRQRQLIRPKLTPRPPWRLLSRGPGP